VLESYLTGLVVCGGIIIAIGAQNAYVLGQSIRREHHWWSAGLCMTSDVILFTLGMFGVSAALMAMPQALEVLRWLGVVFLGWLALQALVRAGWGRSALETDNATQRSVKGVVLTTAGGHTAEPSGLSGYPAADSFHWRPARKRHQFCGRRQQCLCSLVWRFGLAGFDAGAHSVKTCGVAGD